MLVTVPTTRPLAGSLQVPGDKSLGHRALLYGALRHGVTTVRGLGGGADLAATAGALRALGVRVDATPSAPADRQRPRGRAADGVAQGLAQGVAATGEPAAGSITFTVSGAGFDGLRAEGVRLDCGNSGTSMRLLLGLLAGRPGPVTLDGDESLRRRPMERVAAPLRRMGAGVETGAGGRPPVTVKGGELTGIECRLQVASAQVKSALLLAGLQAGGRTTVYEPGPSRDHTERALARLGVPVGRAPGMVWVEGPVEHVGAGPLAVEVPGDPSSASFLLGAALVVPGSDVRVEGLCLNPGRIGAFEVWKAMGAGIDWAVQGTDALGEPIGWARARGSRLGSARVAGDLLVRAIDEIPILAATAAAAGGSLDIADAAELRVKESDRLATVAAGLRGLGAEVEERPDGMRVGGGARLRAGEVDGHGDHRVAMALFVAALAAGQPGTRVAGWEGVATSYPEFLADLEGLGLPAAGRGRA